jgi:hypothetical protein
LSANKRLFGFTAVFTALLFATASSAQVREALCNSAKAALPNATIQIQERLQRYAECVSKSDGSEDCRTEFNRLRSQQSSFETITREIRTYCRI